MKTLEPKEVRFVAQINNVKELRLIGVANLDFWNKQLRDKPFRAFAQNGNAEITICATELVWKRFRFNEFTISLAIADDSGQRQSGYFLLHAFNSNRFFAFCERFFFSTPYFFGKTNLNEKISFLIDVRTKGQSLFKARMNDSKRTVRKLEENWEGAVFLPNAKKQNLKYFVARMSGETEIYPFSPKFDELKLQNNLQYTVFGLLIDSGFAGREWRARGNAFHAKSKTYLS